MKNPYGIILFNKMLESGKCCYFVQCLYKYAYIYECDNKYSNVDMYNDKT